MFAPLAPRRGGDPSEAALRGAQFTTDVRAGARAVHLGLVRLEVAIQRLKARYPVEAHQLRAADLLS